MEFEYKLEKLLTKVNNKTKINNYVFKFGCPNIPKLNYSKRIILNKIFRN